MFVNFLAGTAGIEPALEVLETPVLPLYDVPVYLNILKLNIINLYLIYFFILAINAKNRKSLE